MKRYFAIFLALVLVFNFTFSSFSYADTIDDIKNVEIGSEPIIEDLNGNGNSPELGNIDSIEPFNWGGIIGTIIGGFIGFFDIASPILVKLCTLLPTIDGCIFNTQNWFRLSFFEATPDGLAGNLQSSISAIYNAFRYLVTAAYIVILVYLAIRMMVSSVGRQKAHYKELFKHWLVGLLLLFSFHWVMAFIIWLSNTFVDILANLAKDLLQDTPPGRILGIPIITQTDIQNNPITGFVATRICASCEGGLASILGVLKPIVGPILALLLLGSAFSIIITYFKRLFTIAVLILTFPLVALSYVFDKIGDRKAQTLSIWIKEFTVNVMIQPIHAIILVFISLLFATGLSNTSELQRELFSCGLFGPHLLGAAMSLIALRLIPIGEDLLKKLFQINASMGPGSQGIAGSMAKAGMALRGAKEMAGSLKKAGSGVGSLIKRHQAGKALWKDSDEGKAFANKNNQNHGVIGRNTVGRVQNTLAKRKFLKEGNGKDAYKKYTDDMCERLGVKSLAGARALALSQASGMSLGVGTALSGADSGKFLSEAGARAVIGATLTSGVVSPFVKAPPKDAKDYEKRANDVANLSEKEINNLSKEDKQRIAGELGISIDEVNGKNKDLIVQSYRDMAIGAKYGTSKDNLKSLNKFSIAQKNIKDDKMPDGTGKLDYNKFSKITQTKNGVYGEYNGHVYQLNKNGNSKLEDGKSVSIIPSLVGQPLTEENLMNAINNPEYNVLAGKKAALSNDLSTAKANMTVTQTELTKARIARDNAKDALKQNPNDTLLQTELADKESEFSKASDAHDDARKEVARINSEISKTEAEMTKIYKEERHNQLSADKAISNMANTSPSYAETAYEAVTKNPGLGSIQRDSSGVTLSYSYTDNSGNPATTTYTINTQGGTPSTLTHTTAPDVQSFIGNSYIPPTGTDNIFQTLEYAQENFARLSDDFKHGRNGVTQADIDRAEIELQSFEAQARNTYATEVSRLSTNPSEVTILGGNSDMLGYFETDQAVQEAMGSSFILNVEPPADNGFEYGICTDLTNLLSSWENKQVIINLSRISNDKLHYVITNVYTNNIVAEDDINIGSNFNNQSLGSIGSNLNISHNSKGAWFSN